MERRFSSTPKSESFPNRCTPLAVVMVLLLFVGSGDVVVGVKGGISFFFLLKFEIWD